MGLLWLNRRGRSLAPIVLLTNLNQRWGLRLHGTGLTLDACCFCFGIDFAQVSVKNLKLLVQGWLRHRVGLIVHEVLFEHLGDKDAQLLDVTSLGLQQFLMI